MGTSQRVTAQLEPVRPISPVARLTLRTTVVLGFGLTLGLWLLAGYRLTQRMTDLEAQTTAISGRYMRAQELLSTTRAQVLLGSVLVRDALLDPDVAAAGSYRQRFEDTYIAATLALQQYVPVIDSPDERARVRGLGTQIDDFHHAMLEVFATDSREWPRDARALLQQRVVPKREVVLRVSDEVQAMNRLAFVQQRVETAEL